MRKALLPIALFVLAMPVRAQEDLFAEAGASRERSKWITIGFSPARMDIAMRADDTVLVSSGARGIGAVAMKIDGVAFAADCKDLELRETGIISGGYRFECTLPEGTSDLVATAEEIIVQISTAKKTTKPKSLKPGQLEQLRSFEH